MDWLGIAALVTAGLGGMATLVVAVATMVVAIRGGRVGRENAAKLNGLMDERVESARVDAYQRGWQDCLREIRAATPLPMLGVGTGVQPQPPSKLTGG